MTKTALRVTCGLAALLITACFAAPDPPSTPNHPAWRPDAISGATQRYLPVEFPSHDRHAQALAVECAVCHHPVDGEFAIPVSCRSCHGLPDAAIRMPTAMHTSCRGCHVERTQLGQQSGPVDCLDCHRERS